MLLFGYGSLMEAESASRTLRRTVEESEIREAVLLDHRRDWGVAVPISFDGAEVSGRFLDVVPTPGSYVNGTVLRISAEELALLRIREAQYAVVDISALVRPAPGDEPVVTFVGRGPFRVADDDATAVVPARYRAWIERLADERGPAFAAAYAATTRASVAPEVDGVYRFAAPDQAVAAHGDAG